MVSPYRHSGAWITGLTLACLAGCLTVAFVCGLWIGRIWASEDFYEKCAGGEVYIDTGSKTPLEAIGCAEIARRVR